MRLGPHSGICAMEKIRRSASLLLSSKPDVVLSLSRRATLGFFRFRILTLYGLGFGADKLAGVAGIRFRVDTPESNWLNLGLGVSRRSVKNKMFCANVISHESGLTTVPNKAVGHQRQRSIKNSCVCWHFCCHTARFAVTRCATTGQKLKSAAMTKLLRERALSS